MAMGRRWGRLVPGPAGPALRRPGHDPCDAEHAACAGDGAVTTERSALGARRSALNCNRQQGHSTSPITISACRKCGTVSRLKSL